MILGGVRAILSLMPSFTQVVLMLGEPSDKYGGGRFRAVGISYETLGAELGS